MHTEKRGKNLNMTLNIVIKSQDKRMKEEERKKKALQNNPKTMNKMVIRSYTSIIILKVNGLNAPIKRHRVIDK